MRLDQYKPLVFGAGLVDGTPKSAGGGYVDVPVRSAGNVYHIKMKVEDMPSGLAVYVANIEAGRFRVDDRDISRLDCLKYDPAEGFTPEHYRFYINEHLNRIRAILHHRDVECNRAMQALSGTFND